MSALVESACSMHVCHLFECDEVAFVMLLTYESDTVPSMLKRYSVKEKGTTGDTKVTSTHHRCQTVFGTCCCVG